MQFVYEVTDADGDTDQATVTVTAQGANDVLRVSAASVVAGGGSVAVNPDGTLTWDPGAHYQHLAAGESAQVRTAYAVDDGHGGSDRGLPTVTVQGLSSHVTYLTNGNDVYFGMPEIDEIHTFDGSDQVFGEPNGSPSFSDDVLLGGAGSDYLVGDSLDSPSAWRGRTLTLGSDRLEGADAVDWLVGDNNTLRLTTSSIMPRTLVAGNDVVVGGLGDDHASGDWLVWGGVNASTASVTVLAGADVLDLGDGNDTAAGDFGYLDILGTHTPTFVAGGDEILAGAGNDRVYGDGYRLTMWMTPASVTGGDDRIDAGDGSDEVIGDVWELDWETGVYNGGSDTITGGAGNDRLVGDFDKVVIGGSVFAGSDVLDGGDGSDIIVGDTWQVLSGGGVFWGRIPYHGGDDVIVGGAGNDDLWGDVYLTGVSALPGNDVFVFAPGSGVDVIHDFRTGRDRLDVSAFGFAGIQDLTFHTTPTGVAVDFGTGDGVLLEGLTAPPNASDFIF